LDAVIFIRSLAFNLLFYVLVLVLLLVTVPTLVLPRRAVLGVARTWGRGTVWLLRRVCRIDVEWRGLEKIPRGGVIIAAKHQSAWETVVLSTMLPDFAFVVKRELFWIPLFGWCLLKARMIPVDRGGGKPALAELVEHARVAIAQGRQIIIFPEGTRRPPGAPPRYKYGVAHLYAECGAVCVPIALNSGLYWPRRRFLRYPGTVRVEILDPIPPGDDRDVFFAGLQRELESATARLLAEGADELDRALPGTVTPASMLRETSDIPR
jgi:1-acyl-sn-glycerol-3-phosphate acyltransferase